MKKKSKSFNTTEALAELLKGQFRIENKLDLHIQKTESDFKAIQVLDEKQNAILEEHHNRSNQLKIDNELREKELRRDMEGIKKEQELRLSTLEIPQKWLDHTKTLLLYVAAIMGAIVAVKTAINAVVR